VLVNGRIHELGFTVEQLDHSASDEMEWLSGQNAWTKD